MRAQHAAARPAMPRLDCYIAFLFLPAKEIAQPFWEA